MLFPDYSDAEIVTAAIFYKEHRAEPPIMSRQELRDEPLLADLEPRWLEIAGRVAGLSGDNRAQLAASYRKKFEATFATNFHDTPIFNSNGRVEVGPIGKITRGWEPKGSNKP